MRDSLALGVDIRQLQQVVAHSLACRRVPDRPAQLHMLAAEMLVVGPEENSLRNLHLVPQGTLHLPVVGFLTLSWLQLQSRKLVPRNAVALF